MTEILPIWHKTPFIQSIINHFLKATSPISAILCTVLRLEGNSFCSNNRPRFLFQTLHLYYIDNDLSFRFVLELAEREDGIIVSNDQYRDLMLERNDWRKIIEERYRETYMYSPLLLYAYTVKPL